MFDMDFMQVILSAVTTASDVASNPEVDLAMKNSAWYAMLWRITVVASFWTLMVLGGCKALRYLTAFAIDIFIYIVEAIVLIGLCFLWMPYACTYNIGDEGTIYFWINVVSVLGTVGIWEFTIGMMIPL